MNKTKDQMERYITDAVDDVYPRLHRQMSYLYGFENSKYYVPARFQMLDSQKDILDIMNSQHIRTYTTLYDMLGFFTWAWAAPEGTNVPILKHHPASTAILLAYFSYDNGTVVMAIKETGRSDPLHFQHENNEGPLYNKLVELYTSVDI